MSDTQNPPLLDEARAYYEQLLRPVFADHKFVLPGIIAVLLGNVARQLGLLGVARPFLIAGSRGTGAVPPSERAALRVLDVTGKDPVDTSEDWTARWQTSQRKSSAPSTPGTRTAQPRPCTRTRSPSLSRWPGEVPTHPAHKHGGYLKTR